MTPDLNHRLGLAGQILHLLREHPEGLSGYQLTQLLKARHSTYILHRELTDRLVPFRTYFLLFNALHHLCDHLWAGCEACLEISPLSLRLHPCVDSTQALEQGDPLRGHYPGLRHLGETGEANVGWLLQSFWMRMQGSEEKTAALALFELEGAADCPVIKLRYRQPVSRHHPNRGGSTVHP